MKNIRIGIITYLIYCLSLYPVLADTASLLPNAVQQFFDNNGNPLTSGKVYTYTAGTSTLKTTWKDSAETLPNTNPITLDAGGKAIIYGSGNYRQVVKDRNGNLVWDAVTAPGGGGSSPTSVGDGNLVGTVLPWSGLVAPNQYVFAYGQELVRATYPEYFTAVTQQLNVICSSASNILTGLSDTSQVKIGSAVELSLCVASGTTVTSKTSSTITLSNPSSVSINSTATFFPWGNGNGSTTFNVPDLRGYVLAGRDNMGGTSAGRITTTNCLSGITPDALGAVCGSDSHTLLQAELPAFKPAITITDPGHTHTYNNPQNGGGSALSGGAVGGPSATTSSTTGITAAFTNNLGSGTAFSNMQPTVTINYIAKVTPDTSTSIATGVYSVGGMTGVISCGTGILCTGNIISATGTVPGGVANSVQYNNTGAFAGSPNYTFISPDNLVLGAAGVTGKFDIVGSTSGVVRQVATAIAGTPTITWGTGSGTPAVSATAPLAIAATGAITCISCATIPAGGALSATSPVTLTAGVIAISASTLSRVNDTNVTLTLSGSPTTALIAGVGMTMGWSGQLALTRGGTNASLTASNGGIIYSDASAFAVLSGTATAGQILRSGLSAAPSWSTATYPATVAAGQILAAATSNTIAGTSTPTLGASGTLGSITMGNATSGLLTLQPATGALGTVTVSIPAATDTLVNLASSQALTTKTYNGLNVSTTTGTFTLTNAKTFSVTNTITLSGTDAAVYTFPNATSTIPRTVSSGAKALATGAIASAACTAVQTDVATGTLTTDVVAASFNSDPTAVTGYVPLTTGMLTIIIYPTADTVNFKVCNNTAASITPGAITLNWRVTR